MPRLYSIRQGELELIDRGMVAADFKWDLLANPPDLSSFRFNDDSMTFEVDLDNHTVQYHQVKDDVATYLPGFAQDRTDTDLIGWLDQEIRDPSVRQPVLREWLHRAVRSLLDASRLLAGATVEGAIHPAPQAGRAIADRQRKGLPAGIPAGLVLWRLEIVASDQPGHAFTYPADMALYPAHSYYTGLTASASTTTRSPAT